MKRSLECAIISLGISRLFPTRKGAKTMSEKRRDNRNRILRSGESQRKDGRYAYKYTDTFGKVQFVYEAIISDEIFTIVHDRFSRRTRVAPNREASYLLSGYIKCAHCGNRMNRNGNNGYPHFRCITHAYAPDKCPCPSVRESALETAILTSNSRPDSGACRR